MSADDYTVPMLARLAGVGEDTVLAEIRRGCLKADRDIKPGGKVYRTRVDKAEGDRWLEFYVPKSQDHEAHRETRRKP